MTTFAELTTTQVSEAEANLVAPADREALARTYVDLMDEPLLVIGGGSNTIVADEGFDGQVLQVVTRGIEFEADGDDTIVRADAGESWPQLVNDLVDAGFRGVEALAGIPGSVGAAPVQNIGAYGQELADALERIELVDAGSGEVRWLAAAQLGLGYRTSALKRGELRGLIRRVELRVCEGGEAEGAPIRYAQLAQALGVQVGERVPVRAQRDAVLRLRATKGMVLDARDPDSRSTGSFFVNPVVRRSFAAELPSEAPRFPAEEDAVKLSAAWLIEHAGIGKGFALPNSGAAVSSKHTLAITNHDHATAEDIIELARFIVARVAQEFGVILQPEPNLIGLELG